MKTSQKAVFVRALWAFGFLMIDLCVTTLLHVPFVWCARSYLISSVLEQQAWLLPLFASMIVDQARALPIFWGPCILAMALGIRMVMENYLNHTPQLRAIISASIVGVTVLWGMKMPLTIMGAAQELWMVSCAIVSAYLIAQSRGGSTALARF